MIVILLTSTRDVLFLPCISGDKNDLVLCEDGLDRGDSAHIIYACPSCSAWLFKSSELKWADRDGYWKSPPHTLQKPCYDIPTETITCPSCSWTSKFDFFSYMG